MHKILLFMAVALLLGCAQGHKKARLSDVNTITLKAGEYTTGRRNSPVPQMKCVGGAAAGKYSPRVAQCTKVGFDGIDYQWKCTAEMPTDYEFGKITVSCEGYDHPDDPYILHGSCGLEYELEYTADLKRGNTAGRSKDDPINILGTVAVVVLILIVLFVMCRNRNDDQDRPSGNRRGGGDGPGYPPGPDGPDYPEKPFRQPTPPPSYDETFSTQGTTRQRNSARTEETRQARPQTMGWGGMGGGQGQNNGPGFGGFWTGAGLGALGGYFMGRNQGGGGQHQEERRRTPAQTSQRSYGFSRSSTPPSSSSTTHESTGYGGTSRR